MCCKWTWTPSPLDPIQWVSALCTWRFWILASKLFSEEEGVIAKYGMILDCRVRGMRMRNEPWLNDHCRILCLTFHVRAGGSMQNEIYGLHWQATSPGCVRCSNTDWYRSRRNLNGHHLKYIQNTSEERPISISVCAFEAHRTSAASTTCAHSHMHEYARIPFSFFLCRRCQRGKQAFDQTAIKFVVAQHDTSPQQRQRAKKIHTRYQIN